MSNLKGLRLHDEYFESAWVDARKRIENNPDMCIVPDLESGFPIVMTIDERQSLINIYEECRPKSLKLKDQGKVFVFGTGGEPDINDFNDLFYNR